GPSPPRANSGSNKHSWRSSSRGSKVKRHNQHDTQSVSLTRRFWMRNFARHRLFLASLIMAARSATGVLSAAEPAADPARLAKVLGPGGADGWTIAPAAFT